MKIAKLDIGERTTSFSLRIIRLYRALSKDEVGRVLGRQMLRSGTSIGANVYEAQGAQSRKDFIAKISIAQKETLETGYWLRLIRESGLTRAERVAPSADETDQLTRILAKILLSSKNRSKISA